MIKATGLWLNTDKEGNKYFSGSLGNARVVIFKNNFKEEGSNEPDYNMYFAEQVKKEIPKTTDDDIPF